MTCTHKIQVDNISKVITWVETLSTFRRKHFAISIMKMHESMLFFCLLIIVHKGVHFKASTIFTPRRLHYNIDVALYVNETNMQILLYEFCFKQMHIYHNLCIAYINETCTSKRVVPNKLLFDQIKYDKTVTQKRDFLIAK